MSNGVRAVSGAAADRGGYRKEGLMATSQDVPWEKGAGPGRESPRECIRAARDALNRAYGQSEAPWPLIAEAVDWQRRALEQMTESGQE